MGKRFSESAAKKVAGNQRKREQAHAKDKAHKEALEAQEAAKWEQGADKGNPKKQLEEQKRQEKLRAKKEREELLAAEEAALGKGGKGR
ncbi:LAME_0C02124g1_1 [Lachancea meyersii CBS 8951]|uniref:LAME_0C02124g1_1 n=1 Tax=Lachancea meyersii CBS 8951 TaxID=1266667 RepID=A0A1G4IZM9_9SACH|nr:LAME_0C02124g1_1 [Lachancea meyersii CBS 8951]